MLVPLKKKKQKKMQNKRLFENAIGILLVICLLLPTNAMSS